MIQPDKTLREKLEDCSHGYQGDEIWLWDALETDQALRIMREHFDSKKDELWQTVAEQTDEHFRPTLLSTMQKIETILFGEQ